MMLTWRLDNLVNGEYALPPGEKAEMFALVREVAAGYTVVGTTYSYNDKNQLVQRRNLVRDEEHRYSYDARGKMTNNGRSQYIWNDENQLIEVRFPDGEGVWYTYDAMGRRTSRTTFNAQEKGRHPTYFEYEGSSWRVVREEKKNGETHRRLHLRPSRPPVDDHSGSGGSTCAPQSGMLTARDSGSG